VPSPVIETIGLTKAFPGVVANDRIDLEIRAGEIHAIVGENGAGKSTLMRILCGLYQPDLGEIRLRGVPTVIRDPRHAIKLGIGMVHQHFMLVDRFTVTENVILGAEGTRWGRLDRRAARRRILEICDRYGFDLDPDLAVEELSVGQQQRVEIVKVLYRGADIIIMDEPTAVLVPQEVQELFDNLRRLAKSGKTIIFISHKLDEVLDIADRITVLRGGRKVGTVKAQETDRRGLAEMMVGRPVLFSVDKEERAPGEPLLKVEGLSLKSGERYLLRDVSLEVRGGEIYGIAGVEGNGQTELVEVIMGLRRPTTGRILLAAQDVTGLPVGRVRGHGVSFVPEDRHRRGLILNMTVWENLFLGRHRARRLTAGPLLRRIVMLGEADELVQEYDIRVGSTGQPVSSLSGGNQQKVILARELAGQPRVIIASQPTRGLDVGAIEFVRQRLIAARAAGLAVLIVSADLEEVLALSDRIGVMYGGRLVKEVAASETTAQELGMYMLGSTTGAKEARDHVL